MGDAYDAIAHREEDLEQLIGDDGTGVSEAKERVVREDGLQAERLRVEHGLVGERREGRVPVNDVDLLADEDVPYEREAGEEGGQGALVVHHPEGQVVHLQTTGHVADTRSATVGVRYEDHLVSLSK